MWLAERAVRERQSEASNFASATKPAHPTTVNSQWILHETHDMDRQQFWELPLGLHNQPHPPSPHVKTRLEQPTVLRRPGEGA